MQARYFTPLNSGGFGGGAPYPRRFDWAGYTLGFALSGFFDGILLHQILQWHHLLSAIDSGAFGDLRVQVMADGLFHALMYVIAAVGLWLLYRSREAMALPGGNRRLLANFWIGFGVWHAVDAIFSHWLTGIHRIRMDSPNPLAWDLAWLILFGLIPLVAGIRMRRRSSSGAGAGGGGAGIAASWVALVLTTGALLGAALNAWPLRDYPDGSVTVVLGPGANAGGLFRALEGTDARVAWTDAGGGVWVLTSAQQVDRLALYRHGAIYVSGTVAPAGCSAWVSAGTSSLPADRLLST
ncbi:DUF2243 domain-containing protein [Cupriavidus sp. AU9028]|uniref:DUF2243 domain-containing protein n=1 Tax=Cupriavidus sp. AU9028 TaxID=2871157 RepID=UPI001C98345C|nr:DUF2243 domain-containing protein [Cupriavidus sp. AU9028]MBY4897702.1 DUF2243 domain-containing protein [Cupriavidus sp. AU9028]